MFHSSTFALECKIALRGAPTHRSGVPETDKREPQGDRALGCDSSALFPSPSPKTGPSNDLLTSCIPRRNTICRNSLGSASTDHGSALPFDSCTQPSFTCSISMNTKALHRKRLRHSPGTQKSHLYGSTCQIPCFQSSCHPLVRPQPSSQPQTFRPI
jgi:hypothetical protein